MTFPRLNGQVCNFTAHGNVFFCKRLARDCWALWKLSGARVRFGNLQEIGEDIAAVKLSGTLPGKAVQP